MMSFAAGVIRRFILYGHDTSTSDSQNSTVQPMQAASNTVENTIYRELLGRRENIKIEIQDFARHTLAFENLLNALVRRLSRATKSRFVASAVSQELEEVLPRWKALCQVFRDELWSSREMVGNARAAAEDYANVFVKTILLNRDLGVSEMQKAIEKYSQFKPENDTATNTVESLKAISTEFESLNAFWENTVETHKVVIDRSAVKDIDAEIEEISKNIREYQHTLSTFGHTLEILPFANNALSFLSNICPFEWSKAVTALSTTADHPSKQLLIKLDEQKKKLRRLEEQRANMTKSLRVLESIDASLRQARRDFVNVKKGLETFTAVWSVMHNDLMSTAEDLPSSDTQTSLDRDLFRSRVSSAREVYLLLGELLREYQISVSPAS